ncbi:MAG: PD40 domain-containing protein, partial [Candidatus Aminicenantes bacterium]
MFKPIKILRKSIIFMVLFLITIVGNARAEEIYFTTTPTISPDAIKIVFSYEGDLWIVNVSGGTAYRLTGMAGEEKYPRFSPDGQWIAFSGSQDGNVNVYVMPAQGGDIKQLTFHDTEDQVDSWSWDSKYIYFTSNRYNNFTGFKVSREGGTPQRLVENYFNTLHGMVEHPISLAYYFTDSDESLSFASRKGYKGEYNPDIKSYNPKTRTFILHTSYKGKDFWHTIDQQGNLYFVSDRDNGEYNLYQLKNQEKIKLTDFKTSIKMPQVSANGEKIVFEKDYQLFTYSVPDKRIEKVNIRLFRNDTLKLEQDFEVNGKITYFDVSPDSKKFAFVSRGELFVSDTKGKFIRQLQTGKGRVMEVKWLKDSKTLLFNQTVDGWLNLFKIRSHTGDKEVQLTADAANNRNITLDKEMTQALYLSGTTHLKVMDLKTFKVKTAVTDELWGYDNSQPYFSPDARYIVFTAHRNFEEDLLVHHLESGHTINLTNSGVSEGQPFWSPDGKYIFFVSNRFHPFFPHVAKDFKIYRLPLHKYTKPFKSTEFDKLFEKEDTQKTGPSKTREKNRSNKPKPGQDPVISIDVDELSRHWYQVSPDPGTQGFPYVINKNHETIVLYLSDHDGEPLNLWKTTIKPFEVKKTGKIKGAVTYKNPLISTAADKYYALVNGTIGEVDVNGNSFKPITMKYTFRRNLKSEFSQMFFELWAGVQENFYDETFHGNDWKNIKEKYQRFLPYIRSRSDLRTLIDDMLGELNSSHMGFRSHGEEEKTFHSMKSMLTGLVFENQDPYTVKAVVTDSPVDKKGIDIKPGDLLVAVNHHKISPGINREYYFAAPAMEDELSLTFQRKKEKESQTFTVKIHPVTSRSFKQNLYDEWIRDNQRLVDEKSGRRIAYIHMKNMRTRELENFLVEMTTEWYKREGLILDLRYNTGGNVHDAVLNFLSQKPYTQWKYQGGKFAPQPNFAPAAKPIVLLVNEQSLSDAELTTEAFKVLNLGKVIGTETYRWLIFTSGKTLVDGSYYRLPSWGCYTLDKKNIEWTGVKPDIYMKTTLKDRLEGKDPQL